MKGKTIIIIGALTVIAAVLLLCACMQMISEPPEETKEYNPDEMSLPSVIEQTPTAQNDMQKKFGAYGYEETGENGEKIFYLFSEEQIAESVNLREDGVRRSLTYDELLFLINDSVRMYYEYDKIVLPVYEDETLRCLKESQIILGGRFSKDEVREYAIEPYHGDFSEFQEAEDAAERYDIMTVEILTVITERIYFYDTGTQITGKYWGSGIGRISLSDQLLLDGGKISELEQFKLKLKDTVQMLNDKLSVIQGYKDMEQYLSEIETEYPLVIASRFYSDLGVRSASLICYENGKSVKLFPTEEIEALNPLFYFISADSYINGDEKILTLKINRIDKICTLNALGLSGELKEEGIRLILTFGNNGSLTIERTSDGSYKLINCDFDDGVLRFDNDAVFSIYKIG